jgi:hypothetical protein
LTLNLVRLLEAESERIALEAEYNALRVAWGIASDKAYEAAVLAGRDDLVLDADLRAADEGYRLACEAEDALIQRLDELERWHPELTELRKPPRRKHPHRMPAFGTAPAVRWHVVTDEGPRWVLAEDLQHRVRTDLSRARCAAQARAHRRRAGREGELPRRRPDPSIDAHVGSAGMPVRIVNAEVAEAFACELEARGLHEDAREVRQAARAVRWTYADKDRAERARRELEAMRREGLISWGPR